VILYTDGACSGNPGPGGWAYILIHPASQRVKKGADGVPNTTNNRMELTAVIEGLQAISTEHRWRVQVVCDSEYVVLGIQDWLPKWLANGWRRGRKADSEPVKNVDLWKQLHALTQQFDMTYKHVRGHSGDPLNEECDRMALAAIKRLKREIDDG